MRISAASSRRSEPGGWGVAAAGLVALLIYSGTGLYSFSVFLDALARDLGWQVQTLSWGGSLLMALSAFSGVLAGRYILRFGAGRIISAGACLAAAGFLILFRLTTPQEFWLGYTLVGLGLGAAGIVPVSTVVVSRFERGRGRAMGIVMIGISLGALLFAPLAEHLIEIAGWRLSFLFFALMILGVIIPLSLKVIGASPLLPEEAIEVHEVKSQSSHLLLASPPFLLISAAFFLTYFGTMSVLLHECKMLTSLGISSKTAALAVGLTGGIGGAGKFVLGWLCDRLPVRYVTLGCFALEALGVLILMQVKAESPLLWLFVALFGFSMGGETTLMPLVVRRLFRPELFGFAYGLAHFIGLAGGSLAGPPFAAYIFDHTGSYLPALKIFLAAYGIAIGALYFAWGPDPRAV